MHGPHPVLLTDSRGTGYRQTGLYWETPRYNIVIEAETDLMHM